MSDVQSPDSQHSKIGHFRVVGELGEGGMGSVYLGLDETLQRQVALKVIRPEQRLDPLRKARFLREARILSKLDHPNICQFHDFIEGKSQDCLVLELYADCLRRAGRADEAGELEERAASIRSAAATAGSTR